MRHGESTYNVERRVQGHLDQSFLTEAGQTGARQVGAALQDLSFAAIYSSPLKRARETAELIRSILNQNNGTVAPELQITDNLKEINLPLWEGLTFQEVETNYPEGYQDWRQSPHELQMDVPTPDGVKQFYPVPALYEQARQFWREVLPHHPNETILVVAHSGINRCLLNTAIGLEPDAYQALHQSNCGISVLNFAGTFGSPVQLESVNLTAHLGEPLPQPRVNQKGPRFLLVRHGETDWNRQQRFQGQIDVPLNAQGRSQSQQTAAFLENVAIDRAISSPMLRPKETAEIILQKHPDVSLELDDNLREISHGLWEGKLEAEIEQAFPGELDQWKTAPETVQMPEGENLQQVWQRAIAAWTALLDSTPPNLSDRPTTTLVVAHDAVNKAILCHLVGQGPEHFWTFKQGNGSVTVIDYVQGMTHRPLIHALNITSHFGSVLDQTAAGAL